MYTIPTDEELQALRDARREKAAREALAKCHAMLDPLMKNEDVPRETPCRHRWMESGNYLHSLECADCHMVIEHPLRTEYLKNGSNPI